MIIDWYIVLILDNNHVSDSKSSSESSEEGSFRKDKAPYRKLKTSKKKNNFYTYEKGNTHRKLKKYNTVKDDINNPQCSKIVHIMQDLEDNEISSDTEGNRLYL